MGLKESYRNQHLVRSMVRRFLNEGGLKLPPQHRRDLTPQLVREASGVYRQFMDGFNAWLSGVGMPPLEPIRPTGSSTHAEKDIIDRPGATYGDIDFLVSFPVQYASDDATSMRKDESTTVKKYTDLLIEYLNQVRPPEVDVDLTVGGHPLMIIVNLPSGGLAQVDTVVTHPKYAEWMKGRYTPERGIKGYVTGNLYKALGDYLVLTIGTEGVLARLKDGQRVPSTLRAGITYQSISTDFRNFFKDIADYVIEGAYEPDSLLLQYPGLDPDNVNIDDLAYGIVGLARTMERAGDADANQMLATIHRNFVDGMEDNVARKLKKEITPEQEAKMLQLNLKQGERVRRIFGV
jgi:hypothetical protein